MPFLFKGQEAPGLELERAAARQWVGDHNTLIQTLLQRTLDAKLAQYLGMTRQEALEKEGLSADLNSNRFCGAWVRHVPENVLVSMQKIGAMYPGETKVRFKDPSTGKQTERGHTYLTCGRVIIDAVFGQFIDLDKAIAEHPNLFVNRVFVGTKKEAARAFRLKY